MPLVIIAKSSMQKETQTNGWQMRSTTAILISIACFAAGCSTPSVSDQRTTSILSNTRVEAGLSHGQPYQFSLVQGVTRRGEQAQRFEIRHGDCGEVTGWSDCVNDRGRVERKEGPKNTFSRPDQGVWLGYSLFIPEDFPSISPASTHLSQTKVEGEGRPIWEIVFNRNGVVRFSDEAECSLGPLVRWQGVWNDITIYVHYGDSGQDTYFQLYRNGTLLCDRSRPVMHQTMWGRDQQIGMKYGIYQVFRSRYTNRNGPLPTQVVYYDEMLAGTRREDVDVRMREAARLPPVD